MLIEAGASVRGLLSGQEAYDEVHANPPHVLIIDISLRDVSGLTLARRVRALPGGSSVAIVAFTAEISAVKRAEALKSGFEYYVTKPDFGRLLHVLEDAAGK